MYYWVFVLVGMLVACGIPRFYANRSGGVCDSLKAVAVSVL